MKRISVVGNSGSGKSTLARKLANKLDVPHIELDGIFHQAGWEELANETFVAKVEEVAGDEAWVIDGNYRRVVIEGPVWRRADTVVWLDLPRHRVMRQILRRTVSRCIRGTELWNGNREDWRNLFRLTPQRNIVLWAWTQHTKYQRRYDEAMSAVDNNHLDFIRLRSRAEAEAWLAGLGH